MAEVKIKDKKYKVNELKYKDIRKMEKYREDNKMDLLEFDVYILLYTLQKFNPELAKTTLDEFDELLDITQIDRIKEEINNPSGFNKYVEKTKEKNLTRGIGKK
jgi:hypothetical protein